MDYDTLNDRRVSDLTPRDLGALLAAARAHGAPAVTISTCQGMVAWVNGSAVHGRRCLTTLGTVAWLRVADTDPGAAWCAMQAWRLTATPETVRQIVDAARGAPIVGQHVGDVTARDIEILQDYATAKGHSGVEIDVSASGHVVGCFIVDDCAILEIDGTDTGTLVGIAADPAEALLALHLNALAVALS